MLVIGVIVVAFTAIILLVVIALARAAGKQKPPLPQRCAEEPNIRRPEEKTLD